MKNFENLFKIWQNYGYEFSGLVFLARPVCKTTHKLHYVICITSAAVIFQNAVNATYNFSKQYNILSPYYKYASRYISIFLPNMNPFHCTMKHKICWNRINTITYHT